MFSPSHVKSRGISPPSLNAGLETSIGLSPEGPEPFTLDLFPVSGRAEHAAASKQRQRKIRPATEKGYRDGHVSIGHCVFERKRSVAACAKG